MNAAIREMELNRYYDPNNLHSEGTIRGRVLAELLGRHGIPLTGGHVLDLGCGYGGLSIYAAHTGAAVTAIDTSDHKLGVLRRRLEAEGRSDGGSVTVLKGNATDIPLETSSVDQVFTLGVVEWVPLTTPGRDPRAVQVRALAEIARVLKPGGTYILGTKNRWYPVNFVREPHVKWPLINHLPRPVAQTISRAVYRRPYRTYIHSMNGWRAMLEEAGFRSIRTFLPVYFYQFPVDIWPIDGTHRDLDRALREAAAWIPKEYFQFVERSHSPMKRTFMKLVLRARLERLLWPAFIFVAEK